MTRATRRTLLRWTAAGSAGLAGCTTIDGSRGDGASQHDDGGGARGPSSGTRPDPVEIPASDGTVAFAPDVDVAGSGGRVVGDVDLSGAVGTVEVHGDELDAVVYRRIPWQSQTDRTLYATLAVSTTAIYPLWLYCDGTRLREIWVEGTDGTPLREETASGTYSDDGDVDARASFPALSFAVPDPVPDYRIEGDGLAVGTGDDYVTFPSTALDAFADARFDVVAFESVDCTSRCGGSGWHELHAAIYHRERRRLAFGVFYLYPDDAPVSLSYVLALPTLATPGQQRYDADWNRT